MAKIKKDVIISIKGIHETEGRIGEGVEFVTAGEYCSDGDMTTFSYEESELTGLEGTRTFFKVEKDMVTLTREGTVTAQMVFEEKKKHLFAYETPFGATTMGVDTRSIVSKLGENGGNLEIKYSVDMDNAVISRNTFKINIREA